MQKNEGDTWKPLFDDNSNYFKLCESLLCGSDTLGIPDKVNDSLYNGPLKGVTIPVPPIIINSNYPLATDFNQISSQQIPNIYYNDNYTGNVKIDNWTYRKEARIRDKWIKIRVRYSGKNLAVIHSIVTLYNVSYS